MAQFNITTHNGSVAINNAANPEGIYFSAQVTPPLPPNNTRHQSRMLSATARTMNECCLLEEGPREKNCPRE